MPLLASDRPGAQDATDRYGALFVLLLAVVVLAAFDDSTRVVRISQGVLVVAIVGVTARITGVTARRLRHVVLVGAVLAAAVVVAGISGGPDVRGSIAIGSGVVLTMGVAALVRHIFETERITPAEIAGALAAYIELALAFALIYGGIAEIARTPFFAQGETGGFPFLYFSIVTMTTLGYGDLSPATDVGRSLVMLQTLFGQIFLVVLVAYLVGSVGARPEERSAALHAPATNESPDASE